MSTIVAVLNGDGSPASRGVVRKMLAAGQPGATCADVWSDGAVALGVARAEWETAPEFGGTASVTVGDDLVVVADATLYYQLDLRRAIEREAGALVSPTAGPGDLILAAYRAWGARSTERLEGDFAFIVWDRVRHTLFCARDFGGKRTIYFADRGSGGPLLLGSHIDSVLADPRCPRDLNLAAIAADTAGLFKPADETCYRAVSALPAGHSASHTMIGGPGGLRVERHWEPPQIGERGSASTFEDAAAELRSLLRDAVAERLGVGEPTSVWLSGGWDSPAVFAAGELALRERGCREHLRAVSISFPVGDPGREDELIADATGHWGSPVHWLNITDIPLIERAAERAAARAEPFAHAFEMGNRALARGSRATGARVALDGMGGDQLFQVSEIFFADLLRSGRLGTLAHEWRLTGLGARHYRTFFKYAVQPLLPPLVLQAVAGLRGGRSLRGHLERPLPPWLDAEFVRRYDLVERARLPLPPARGRSHAAAETEWYLRQPYFPRVFAAVSGFAREEGVELRSPLYDQRVVRFAAARPREERSKGRQTKRLLRAAMRGLLPDGFLAPRSFRTGVTSGYFARELRERHAGAISAVFDSLEVENALGMVNAAVLQSSWRSYLRQGDGNSGLGLFLAFQAELWLRARAGLRD